jgi:GT2 family glycosyltransferase
MIYHFIPYSLEKNIGKAYNDYCKIVPNDDDWIAVQDADCMILTPNYGVLLQKYIYRYPETGIFTCWTNRIKPNNKNINQQLIQEMFNERDIIKHREKALTLYSLNNGGFKEITRIISGYFMMFKKKTWLEVGGFREEGMLKVDNDFSRKVLQSGKKILLMQMLYCFHYYRMLEGWQDKSHLL